MLGELPAILQLIKLPCCQQVLQFNYSGFRYNGGETRNHEMELNHDLLKTNCGLITCNELGNPCRFALGLS